MPTDMLDEYDERRKRPRRRISDEEYRAWVEDLTPANETPLVTLGIRLENMKIIEAGEREG